MLFIYVTLLGLKVTGSILMVYIMIELNSLVKYLKVLYSSWKIQVLEVYFIHFPQSVYLGIPFSLAEYNKSNLPYL